MHYEASVNSLVEGRRVTSHDTSVVCVRGNGKGEEGSEHVKHTQVGTFYVFEETGW
jgi:hypothetical protein